LAASTVGIHRMRAPSRAAISTASGFMPPTEALSASAPSTWTSPPSASLTTAARSAVGT
jgi:hypothetical protein